MSLRTNMSAGELFELIMPVAFAASALLSTWVLASARKRINLYYALVLAVATLLLPVVVFPLYLAAIILWPRTSKLPQRWRYLLPLLYAAITLSAIGLYVYFDGRTVDAHLARATRAKLVDDHRTAINEYRKALALEDNPHTHKLLAIELENAGSKSEADEEFRLAHQGGEPVR